MSISKNQLKLITSLSQKKYRQKHKLFVAEGVKVVNELLNSSFELDQLFATEDFDTQNKNCQIISNEELRKISSLKTPYKVLGIFKIAAEKEISNKG